MGEGANQPRQSPGTWFRHPKGLTYLFLSGMWEVISLFGMKTILVLYLVTQLKFEASDAIKLYGYSTALSFVMSLLGGVAADRLLGIWRASLLGAVVLALAHFVLVIPALLIVGLVLAAIGSGLFRPSLVGQVWLLYDETDPRRDRALVLYKLGCNIGGIIGPLVCGALFQFYGWTAAMLFAGCGMIVSAAILAAARPHLATRLNPRRVTNDVTETDKPLWNGQRIGLILLAALGGALYWIVANQQGGAMVLWVNDAVDRSLSAVGTSFQIPTAWFQALNPILIIAFTPLLTTLWSRKDRVITGRTELRRMAAGSVMLASAFLLLALADFGRGESQVSWFWIFIAMMPITLSELHLDPMGQAFFSRMAPKRLLSTFIALWFLTSAIGYVGAGWLGDLWVATPPSTFFAVSALVALLSALILFASIYLSRQTASFPSKEPVRADA